MLPHAPLLRFAMLPARCLFPRAPAKPPRRGSQRLRPLSLLVLGCGLGGPPMQATPVTAAQFEQLGSHPRLLADSARWQELRVQVARESISAQLAAFVIGQADRALALPPIKYEKDGRRMLRPIRAALSRILALSMAARLTDQARYHEGAIAEMRRAAALPDWNPSHFLDTAEMTFALALGYDWLFDRISPDDRARFETAIIEKGLKASYPSDGSVPGWVNAHNNWTQVCHAALVAGAIATGARESELSARVLQRALDHLPGAALFGYAPDGAYPEGPSYWTYGTTYHVILADMLSHAFGSAMGTDAYPGFLETAYYPNQMTSPSGRLFNYADGEERRGFAPALFWFARRLRDPAIVEREVANLGPALQRVEDGGDEQGARFSALALLWWNPAIGHVIRPDAPARPLSWRGRGRIPVSVHRSSWNDSRALFVGIKGGLIDASHAHMDLGSFVLDARGVRWAVDPGWQDYTGLEKRGLDLWSYRQDADRWKVFRLGSEAHNILRFNGRPQDVRANAPITDFAGRAPDQQTTVDLSSAYPHLVSAVRRTVKLEGDERVVISDAWTAGSQPVDVAWQWLTRAKATITASGATLEESGETLYLRIVSPASGWRLAVEDVGRLLQPYDEPNPGLRRLVLHTRTAAGNQGRIVVVAEPAPAKSP